MARMLRLKEDLQEVAISADYKKQKWTLTQKEKEAAAAEGEDEDDHEEDDTPSKRSCSTNRDSGSRSWRL
eukprot:4242933-Prymnesium_polylepis.1